jgi:hypothetical protein
VDGTSDLYMKVIIAEQRTTRHPRMSAPRQPTSGQAVAAVRLRHRQQATGHEAPDTAGRYQSLT